MRYFVHFNHREVWDKIPLKLYPLEGGGYTDEVGDYLKPGDNTVVFSRFPNMEMDL